MAEIIALISEWATGVLLCSFPLALLANSSTKGCPALMPISESRTSGPKGLFALSQYSASQRKFLSKDIGCGRVASRYQTHKLPGHINLLLDASGDVLLHILQCFCLLQNLLFGGACGNREFTAKFAVHLHDDDHGFGNRERGIERWPCLFDHESFLAPRSLGGGGTTQL